MTSMPPRYLRSTSGTTMEEVDYVLEKLPPIIKNLRDLSPFGPDKDPTTFQ